MCGNSTDGSSPLIFQVNFFIRDSGYSSCKVSPEGYVPQQIIIEYVPWLTYEEQIKKGYGVPEELRYAQGEAAAKKKIGYNGSTTGKNIKNPNYSMEKNCNYSP